MHSTRRIKHPDRSRVPALPYALTHSMYRAPCTGHPSLTQKALSEYAWCAVHDLHLDMCCCYRHLFWASLNLCHTSNQVKQLAAAAGGGYACITRSKLWCRSETDWCWRFISDSEAADKLRASLAAMFVFSMLIIAAASCRLFVFGGHFETKGTFIANYLSHCYSIAWDRL